MAGLKFEEWEKWDTENLSKQEVIAKQNVIELLDNLWEK
jgi:hypothetical protein